MSSDPSQNLPTSQEDPGSTVKVLGLDPGLTTGWCLLRVSPSERKVLKIRYGEVKLEKFSPWLISLKNLEWIAVEDFILRDTQKTKFMNQGWHTLETAKLVGRVEHHCIEHGIKYRVAQPAEKPFGYKLAGLPYIPGKKGTHSWDAAAHAYNLIRRVYTI